MKGSHGSACAAWSCCDVCQPVRPKALNAASECPAGGGEVCVMPRPAYASHASRHPVNGTPSAAFRVLAWKRIARIHGPGAWRRTVEVSSTLVMKRLHEPQ